MPIALDGKAIAGGIELSTAERAFDSDPTSFWVSEQRGVAVKGAAWIGYTFPEPRKVRRIRLTQTTNPPFRQDLVQVEKSLNEGLQWTPAAPGLFRLSGEVSWIDLADNGPALSWRIIAAGDNAVDPEHAWSVYEIAWFSGPEAELAS
jgi:hypothetical protein